MASLSEKIVAHGYEDGKVDNKYETGVITDDDSVYPGGTDNDAREMRRLGLPQEFVRSFQGSSALCFCAILQATWEFLLISNTQGLVDGVRPGIFWAYVWSFLGTGFIILSIAEMASIAPTAGGHYHWVSEFSPPKYQRIFSFFTGWMSVLSWQTGSASGSFISGLITQSLITVNNPLYEPKSWQGTLLVFAFVLGLYIVNVYVTRELVTVQYGVMALHIGCLLAIVGVLWAHAPLVSSHEVFFDFQCFGGWSNMGLCLMVGQVSIVFDSLNSDAMAHMSEEVKDAGKNVPIAMLGAFLFNGILGLVLIIAFLFAMPSVEDAVNDPSGFPFLYVFQLALPARGVNALTIVLLILVFVSDVAFNAATSRQTFAFARDRGLPFSDWIAKVDTNTRTPIPKRAILVSCLFAATISLINIGSSAAFNAIISLSVSSSFIVAVASIGSLLHRRVFHAHDRPLPSSRWSLGRAGPFVNLVAVLYCTFVFFWSFWPNETHPDLEAFNWSPVIFGGVGLLSLVQYFVKGRKEFFGPAKRVA